MPARKRARRDIEPEVDAPPAPEPQSLSKTQQLRDLWEFAALHQYIHIFGDVVKISQDIDIDVLEEECLKPTTSERLPEIGLALLKYVSSHKGLTPEIFDEYTRRQYVAKAPNRNPFGVEEEPVKFNDMDTFTKIRVLHQLSVWTLNNPDRIKDKMNLTERQQTTWRVDAFGWDKEDRTYFLLDDDRLYRRSAPPLPPPPRTKSKAKPKPKKTRGTRASKRRRLSTAESESAAEEENEVDDQDDFGGMTWECVAVTLEEYTDFVDSIRKSRDKNEKDLAQRLQSEIIPILEEKAEKQRAQETKKQRELENIEKMAHAKRSSRIASRLEKQKEEEAAVEAERKHVADLEMAKKEQERQKKQEEDRESRMMTREQRLKEREVRRILHEEELKKLEEDRQKAEKNEARLSERHLKAEMQRRQKELERMQEEENWVFDCAVCGIHGENVDDGSHSIACEKCNVWQHSACHGIAQKEAERDDFHFACNDCKRKEEDASRPKLPPLKLHMGASQEAKPSRPQQQGATNGLMNGPSLSPQGQTSGFPGIHHQIPQIPPPPPHYSHQPGPVNPAVSPPPMGGFFGNHPHWQPNQMQPNGHVTKLAMSPGRPVSQGSNYPYTNEHPNYASPNRPVSAGYGAPSPSKPSTKSSSFQANGYRFNPPFSSPNPAYPPPSTTQTPSFSPVKHQAPASSPPSQQPQHQHSPPSQQFIHGSSHLLPAAAGGISPEKHDSTPPAQRQGPLSQPPVLPPIAPLAPSANPPILTPPSKKTPEHHHSQAPAQAQTLPAQPIADVLAHNSHPLPQGRRPTGGQ
ncbi:hypothetical protein IWZ03DRAFT_352932 [Phyllosticta citriasiana]|uniref:Zinc finger PHD-type domain-containing protein n=1 Tax=Phyllosticta citriasiana TaxID=595635 RepID=A0ABR1KAU2_9PEZI